MMTAANRHLERQARSAVCVHYDYCNYTMQLDQVSEYFCGLPEETKARYSTKICGVGLKTDPYANPNELWMVEPDQIPNVAWSDMFMYMITTPSAYTREEMKVSL